MAEAETNEEAKPRKSPPKIPDHELLRRIGEGAYGEVWLARNSLGTYRAVKVIHCGRFKHNDRPYEREFTGLKNFEPISRGHEGLVDILQVGRNDDAGYFFYVMEAADDSADQKVGKRESETHPPAHSPTFSPASYRPLTLEDKIRANGRLPVTECIRIAATLADALRYLHERELVHRDIKPSNIIFVDGVPKLADVGLVARTDSARTFVGTEGFLPPEGPGTPKADLYSLGKCLYEMAMGKDRQAFPSPPTRLDELPDRKELLELNEVINKACDPDPAERYQTAQGMLEELQLLQQGKSVGRARTHRKQRRHAGIIGTGTAICGLVVGLLWLIDYQSRPRVLFQDEFDAAQLDAQLWNLSHLDWCEPENGRRTFTADLSGGELVLRATADHYDGLSTAKSFWMDSKQDLRELGSCRLEIELSGSAREGSLAVAISDGSAPTDHPEIAGIKLAGVERINVQSNAWPATTLRIDLLPHSQAAVVYPNTNRLDDFDVVDLRGASVWRLRFHGTASTARGLPGGLVEMRIKRVVVYRHPQPGLMIGRVIEVPSRWPVRDAVIKDASGRTLAKTLANGAFVVDHRGPFTVEKFGYGLVSGPAPGASIGGTFVTVESRKSILGFGDVVATIPCDYPGATSIAFREGRLNLLVHDTDSASTLVPVDTVNHVLAFNSPDTLKRSYEPSIGPLGFVECGTRLIGITHWPGKLLDFDENPPAEITELKHRDGTRLNWPRGMAFDGQWLWFIEQDLMNERFGLHAVDLERMVIANSIKTNDRGICALAWGNGQFWVSSRSSGCYVVSREAMLSQGTVDMARGRLFKGRYDYLAFGEGFLWGLEIANRRICKIKITD